MSNNYDPDYERHLHIAAEMLGIDELPDELKDRLDRVDELLQAIDHNGLRSKQITATIIMQWEQERNA